MMATHLLFGAGYALLGVVLLIAGFFAFDLITPGKLGAKIYDDRSVNAATVVAALFVGLGAVEFTAIFTNGAANFGESFAQTAAFGALGILLQVVMFLVLDAVTPGSLREIAVSSQFHPGAVVAAAAMVAISAIVCASIS